MKKILFAVAMLALSVAMAAQEKGDMYISGTFNISGGSSTSAVTVADQTTTTDRPGTFSFGIAPSFGYFVMDNLEVNLSLDYSLNRSYLQTDNNQNRLFSRTNMFVIRPGASYYLRLADKFYYKPGLSFGIGFGNESEDVDVNTVDKTGRTTVDLTLELLAFEFQPCEHLGITLSAGDLSYNFVKRKHSETAANVTTTTVRKQNTVGLGLNLGAAIGFKYYF